MTQTIKIEGKLKARITRTVKKWQTRFPGMNLDVMINDIATELTHTVTNEKYCRLPYENGYYEKIKRDEDFRAELKLNFNKFKKYLNGLV